MSDNVFHHMWIPHAGDADVLEWRTSPMPMPKANQVRIRVEAAGVINADIGIRQGNPHPGSPPLPQIPGHEVAGIVEAVGESVTDIHVGQSIVAIVALGAYATHIIAESWQCIAISETVAPKKAVCVLVNYWTAYYILHHIVPLKQGDCILIHGISGGVGTAVLELAQQMGLVVYGTASKSKHKQLASYNATLIDYHTEDFERVVRQSAPNGMDMVLDPIGGSNWRKSYRLVKKGGRLVIYGAKFEGSRRSMLPYIVEMAIRGIFPDGKRIRLVGLNPQDNETHRTLMREDVAHLQSMLADGQLDPVIGGIFTLDKAIDAQRQLENGTITGKVVLVPSES